MEALARALLLGLSTGVFCLGFCYPALAPVLLSRGSDAGRGAAAALALFLLGRLLAYLAVGAVLGAAGGFAPGLRGSAVSSAALLLLGLLLALYGLIDRLPRSGFCRAAGRALSRRLLLLPLGFLAGLSPCPPFLIAVAAAAGSGTAWRGIVFFLCFFAGTSVTLAPFLLAPRLARSAVLRAGARIAAVVAGAWYLWLGARGLAGLR